jgi:hypothetical protein
MKSKDLAQRSFPFRGDNLNYQNMKVLFLAVLLLAISQFASAQDSTIYRFCEIHIYKKPNGKVTIGLDDGTKTYSPLGDVFIKDQTGEKMEFNSPMGCANYMSTLGWQYVESRSIYGTGVLAPLISIVFKRPASASD